MASLGVLVASLLLLLVLQSSTVNSSTLFTKPLVAVAVGTAGGNDLLPAAQHVVEEAETGRLETNFDFAWRYHAGDVDSNTTSCTFPYNLTGYQCLGLVYVPANTADECADHCCRSMDCEIWQFAAPASQQGNGCWLGQSNQCAVNTQQLWLSGGRNASVRPPPAKNGPTSLSYNDSSWSVVDVPHDAIITGVYAENATRSHGYLPYKDMWYRKHFNLPAEWNSTSSIWIYFEGVFHMTTVYLNGEIALPLHRGGYTSFSVRLDNITSLRYGNGQENENVLALVTSAYGGTGWWYEGGGIYRHTYLVRTPTPVHIVTHGINPISNVTGDITWHSPSDPSKGMTSSSASLSPVVEIVNDGGNADAAQYTVKVTVMDESGETVTSLSTPTTETLPPMQGRKIPVGTMNLKTVELWSSQRPYLYTMLTEVLTTDGQLLDNITTSFGFRRTKWMADTGFYLNDQPYKWRGFCDHNDFAGVGVAVPERVNLFRAQTMRSVGGNSWRMSHNPPVPALLDILDRVGIVVWDENRDFYNTSYDIDNQRNMVKRDRNHPSVMCWSFCNEAGCESQNSAVGMLYRTVSKEEDPTRPVTGNMFSYGTGKLSEVVDVQGFSHQGGDKFDSFHHDDPSRPTIGSECCSCTTQRGEDVGNGNEKVLSNLNGQCLQSQTGVEMSRQFVAGLLVWTLFDYYGEPAFDWPHRSSSFGAIDLAGFPKAAAFYYRAWWLHNSTNMTSSTSLRYDVPHRPVRLQHVMSDQSNAKRVGNDDQFIAHIVQHWQPYVGGDLRSINAYTNAPQAELFVNGQSQGVKAVPWISLAQWDNVMYEHGNLTVAGLDANGKLLASHTVLSPEDPVKLSLTIDAPSASTGTGSALVMDGFDTALLRASILDLNGQVVPSSSHNVTFTIVSGPGRVVAVGNGDPQCHEPNQVNWRSAYHGLVRAMVRVTEHRVHSAAMRQRMLRIDADGGRVTKVFGPGCETEDFADAIVVQASAVIGETIAKTTVSVPISTDTDRHGVLAVASKWMRD